MQRGRRKQQQKEQEENWNMGRKPFAGFCFHLTVQNCAARPRPASLPSGGRGASGGRATELAFCE